MQLVSTRTAVDQGRKCFANKLYVASTFLHCHGSSQAQHSRSHLGLGQCRQTCMWSAHLWLGIPPRTAAAVPRCMHCLDIQCHRQCQCIAVNAGTATTYPSAPSLNNMMPNMCQHSTHSSLAMSALAGNKKFPRCNGPDIIRRHFNQH